MPSLSARSTSALPCSRMSTHLWSPLAHRDSAVLPFSSCLQLCYLLTHRTAQTQKQAATRVGPGQPSRVLCLCGGAAFLGSARKSIRLDLQRKQQYMMRRHDCDLHVAVSSLFNKPLDKLRLSIEGSKMKVGLSFIICGVDALATANTVHSRHSTSFLTPCVHSPCCYRARTPTPLRHSKFRISSGEYSLSLFFRTQIAAGPVLAITQKKAENPKENQKFCILDVIYKVREPTLLFFNILRTLFPASSSPFPRRGTRRFGSHRLRTEFPFPHNTNSLNLVFWDANLSVHHS